jgi:hypothetical protein
MEELGRHVEVSVGRRLVPPAEALEHLIGHEPRGDGVQVVGKQGKHAVPVARFPHDVPVYLGLKQHPERLAGGLRQIAPAAQHEQAHLRRCGMVAVPKRSRWGAGLTPHRLLRNVRVVVPRLIL